MTTEAIDVSAKQRLLDQVLALYGDSGPRPTSSMRQVAGELGISHALFSYHFGSWPRFLAAVLAAQRRRDNTLITAGETEPSFAQLLEAIWRFYANPRMRGRAQAFFHVAGLATYDPDTYAEFVDSLDTLHHLLTQAAEREGSPRTQATTKSLLAVATLRGLLLQRLLDPHSTRTDQAATELIHTFAPHTAAPQKTKRQGSSSNHR